LCISFKKSREKANLKNRFAFLFYKPCILLTIQDKRIKVFKFHFLKNLLFTSSRISHLFFFGFNKVEIEKMSGVASTKPCGLSKKF